MTVWYGDRSEYASVPFRSSDAAIAETIKGSPVGVRRELSVVDPYGRFVRWLANKP